MSDKPPLGLRPRWLVLEERHLEIRNAINSYDERALLAPDEWLLELKEIEDQLAELRKPVRVNPEPVDAKFTPPAVEIPGPTAPTTQPRRFVSISRTILKDGDHILDAIDNDGIAWWRRLDTQPHHPAFPAKDLGWQQLSPLPARELPTEPAF